MGSIPLTANAMTASVAIAVTLSAPTVAPATKLRMVRASACATQPTGVTCVKLKVVRVWARAVQEEVIACQIGLAPAMKDGVSLTVLNLTALEHQTVAIEVCDHT